MKIGISCTLKWLQRGNLVSNDSAKLFGDCRNKEVFKPNNHFKQIAMFTIVILFICIYVHLSVESSQS
jgi:hypothetical protein